MSELTSPPPSDEEIRRRRQEALRALAQNRLDDPAVGAPSSSSSQPAADQRRPGQFPTVRTVQKMPSWLRVGIVVLVVILLIGEVLHQLGMFPGTSGRQVAPGLVITPSLQDQDCLGGVAWSPNGQEIAVLGYRDECPDDDPANYTYEADVVHVYSAVTGKLLQTILPDPTVLALPNLPAAPAGVGTSNPILNYGPLLWSPDGKQLALTFDVEHNFTTSNGGATTIVGRGLVLVNADGTGERAAFFTYSNPPQYPAVRWDISTLHPGTLPKPSGYQGQVSLSPAEQYSWSSSDQLLPKGSPTASTSPTAPVGNPDGGSSFTVWQPTGLELAIQSNVPTSFTSFPAWSPDGRYLVDSVYVLGLLQPPGPASTLAPGLLDGLPLAIRDPALQRLVKSLQASGSSPDTQPSFEVAWSPSGRLLAAAPSSGADEGAAPVTIYACATGKVLGTLAPKANPAVPANSQGGSFLAWSADGSHLLVYSGDLDTITIWSRAELP